MNYTPWGGGAFHVEHTAVYSGSSVVKVFLARNETALAKGRVPTNHPQSYPHSYPQAYPPPKHVLDPCVTRRSVAQ